MNIPSPEQLNQELINWQPPQSLPSESLLQNPGQVQIPDVTRDPSPEQGQRRWVNIIVACTVCLLCFVTMLAVLHGIGYQWFRVVSGSMRRELPIGSLIITKRVDESQINIDDTIAYERKDRKVVTHKVVDITEHYGGSEYRGFVTQGTENSVQDQFTVPSAKVVGVVVWSAPKIGSLVIILEKAFLVLFIALIISMSSFAVTCQVKKLKKLRKLRKEGEEGRQMLDHYFEFDHIVTNDLEIQRLLREIDANPVSVAPSLEELLFELDRVLYAWVPTPAAQGFSRELAMSTPAGAFVPYGLDSLFQQHPPQTSTELAAPGIMPKPPTHEPIQNRQKETQERLQNKPGKPLSQRQKIMKTSANLVFWLVCAAIVASSVLFAVSSDPGKNYLGFRAYAVVTASMTPQPDSLPGGFNAGDMILIKKCPPESIKPGDIITFNPSARDDGNTSFLTHRVVRVLDELGGQKGIFYVTKGDANPSEDPPISGKMLIGKKIFHLPAVGKILQNMQSHLATWMITAICFFAFLFIIQWYFAKPKPKKKLKTAVISAQA